MENFKNPAGNARKGFSSQECSVDDESKCVTVGVSVGSGLELTSSLTSHSPTCFSSSSVRGPAQLPAAACHAVVRRLPRLEETTLGCQARHLPGHRPALPCLLIGMTERTAVVESTAAEKKKNDDDHPTSLNFTQCYQHYVALEATVAGLSLGGGLN